MKLFPAIMFPKLCVGCKSPGSLICDKCWLSVQFIYDQSCPVCQHPSVGGLTHPRCKTMRGMDGLTSISYYRGPVRSLIRQLKYGGATVISELIEQLIIKYQEHENILLPPGIITAIPLDSHTQRSRGFNQSAVIAEILSQRLGYPYIPDLLQRQRKVISQTKLTKEERKVNMRGAFRISGDNADPHIYRRATILLVDDVFTTGATMREAAKILKMSGASRVYGFTLAKD